jgi:addiction module HigA family antidote
MKTHAPIHSGEVLREDFLIPLGLSKYRVAKDIGVPPRRINEIVKGKRSLTVDTALRLERYFGWPADVWLNLQSHHDQQTAKVSLKSSHALRCENHRLPLATMKRNTDPRLRRGIGDPAVVWSEAGHAPS